MTKVFSRAMISELDFTEAETYLLSYPAAGPDIMRKALLVAAIISYGRPFTQNERDKSAGAVARVDLENDHLLTLQQRKLHDLVIELRNKAIAHSEFSRNPVELGAVQENAIGFKATPFNVLEAGVPVPDFLVLCQQRKKQAMDTSFEAAQKASPYKDAL